MYTTITIKYEILEMELFTMHGMVVSRDTASFQEATNQKPKISKYVSSSEQPLLKTWEWRWRKRKNKTGT